MFLRLLTLLLTIACAYSSISQEEISEVKRLYTNYQNDFKKLSTFEQAEKKSLIQL